MSENINFIPATDLPVAEGEEISVLCLENGAMKQKPASGLGGGSVVVIRASDAGYEGGDNVVNVEPVPEGTFARIKAMFTGGEGACVQMLWHVTYTIESGEVIEDYRTSRPAEFQYGPARDPYPEFVIIRDGYSGNMFGMLADDVIMPMAEFEQKMAEFGGGV